MNGTNFTQTLPLSPARVDPAWRLAGTLDFNADGHPGILWQHDRGDVGFWLMNGATRTDSGLLNPGAVDPTWKIVGPK
jgi:hypothetical protein